MIDKEKLDTVIKYGSVCFNRNSTTSDCAGCPYQEDVDFEHAPKDALLQCDAVLGYEAIELLKQLAEENASLRKQIEEDDAHDEHLLRVAKYRKEDHAKASRKYIRCKGCKYLYESINVPGFGDIPVCTRPPYARKWIMEVGECSDREEKGVVE